jgi:hypothetical protein
MADDCANICHLRFPEAGNIKVGFVMFCEFSELADSVTE